MLAGRRSFFRPTIRLNTSLVSVRSSRSSARASMPVVTMAASSSPLRSMSVSSASVCSTTCIENLRPRSRIDETSLGTRLASAPGVPPMRKGPAMALSAMATSSSADFSKDSRASARRFKAIPAGLRITPALVRSNRVVERAASSCEIVTDIAGCEMLRACAAPVIDPARQTAKYVRNARGSMGIRLPLFSALSTFVMKLAGGRQVMFCPRSVNCFCRKMLYARARISSF